MARSKGNWRRGVRLLWLRSSRSDGDNGNEPRSTTGVHRFSKAFSVTNAGISFRSQRPDTSSASASTTAARDVRRARLPQRYPLGGGVGDTHFGGEALRVAEAMAADAWDADRSFFLLNGSTAGNHAFMLATVRPGDKVIVSRDLHKSLLVALILTGAVPVYLAPRLHQS